MCPLFWNLTNMKRQGTQTSRATRKDNTSLVQDESDRKSYNLRKRKYETEQNVQDESLVNENAKRRCLKNDDQETSTHHKIPGKGQRMQHTKMDTSKEKQPQPRIQKEKALLKQPFAKNIKWEIQTKKTRRLTMKKDHNSKRKTSDSNSPVIQKKTPTQNKTPTQKKNQVKEEHLSKMKLTKRNKDRRQRALHGTTKPGKKRILQGTPKPMLNSKAPGKEISNTSNPKQKARKQSRGRVLKNSNQTKETQFHSNTQQTTGVKHYRMSKPKMMKSTTTASKVATTNDDPVFTTRGRSPTKYFSTLFLQKIDARFHPEASLSKIHGISVSNNNLIWVNHLKGYVQLLNSSGEVLRTIDLDHIPVFNCCTPSGDLLETQGYAEDSKPVITIVSRDGDIRELADLSSYATNLFGILCENERIFVVGYSNKPDVHGVYRGYFIVKLSMSGEIEGVYNVERYMYDNINHIMLLNGQIIAPRTNSPATIPWKGRIISSEKVKGIYIDGVYSESASVDNLGNVIVGVHSELMIIDPSLEFRHKIDADVGNIISTAVDKNNQLWLGTASGKLYSARYLK